ncbi:unnamed protein product [Candidula unifasciata]|uniref:non-specific serine/threonine protein kinase n=1 Tax=Candidula unifasciata TaxID=100452 RepID=A0A8S3YKU7_9EUPU|nr:unnamed protein product [Candidula unifasciata]
MSESALPSPRPTPRFYPEAQTLSVKKLLPGGTPKDSLPPRPPVKSCPPLSRVFPRRNVPSLHAQPVTFRHPEASLLSPKYNEKSTDLYFEQLFEDVTPIGQGSFGEVFSCKSKDDGKYYAVKKSRQPFKGQFDRKCKMEEVAKHQLLPIHPNCIRFYRAWEERGHLYIQTELCKFSLQEYCHTNQNISEVIIWNYMVDLLLALKHLHDHNLVHMDIKPENAFISHDGICKLGDFGLVIDLTKKRDVNDAIEGDPKYLAPELLEGKFGKHADIFSLGMFMLEMASDLDLPRSGDNWHYLRNGSLPEQFLQGRPANMKAVIEQMLDLDYERRPTVDQILALPCLRDVLKNRMFSYMRAGSKAVRNLRSFPSPHVPIFQSNSPSVRLDKDCPFSDDEMDDSGAGRSDLLNLSDEFVMPSIPSAPRRAYTTPAIRRRPASSVINGSPIKRLLFSESQTSTPSTTHSSSTSNGHLSPHELNDRAGTPPLPKMEWDEPKPGIEPKNLLSMFEAASDEEEDKSF